LLVKVINIDPTGKIRLSRKALLNEGATAEKAGTGQPEAKGR
jgi:predicted RNA-binding protein with RPS1 domain